MHGTLFYVLSSFWVGAVHAATPGHGKTITAAYLVGARGKPIDALILGVFVTLSHTSGILLVGVLASLGSAWLAAQRVEAYLALATGLLVVGLGLWMLWAQRDLIRLAFGRPAPAIAGEGAASDMARLIARDRQAERVTHSHEQWHSHEHEDAYAHEAHMHSHDGHEHSHDGHVHTLDGHDHAHNEHAHFHGEDVTWHRHGWGTYHAHRLDVVAENRPKLGVLLALSIAGGLLPDPAALAILIGALSTGQVIFGLVTVLMFSLGFASALVVVGVIAAKVGQKVLTWLSSVWVIRVQVLTTLLILGMGCLLTMTAMLRLASIGGA
jgi:nickel/cobalt exporter